MKAIEFLDGLTRECISLEPCGVIRGSYIKAHTAKELFNLLEDIPNGWFFDDSFYFFFYGEREFTFGFLPDTWWFFPIDADTGVYIWKIDD